jgi:hypothetical protein
MSMQVFTSVVMNDVQSKVPRLEAGRSSHIIVAARAVSGSDSNVGKACSDLNVGYFGREPYLSHAWQMIRNSALGA